MRFVLGALLGPAILAFATPAFALALKNLPACDIVNFAASGSPVAIPEERWADYRDKVVAILSVPGGPGGEALQQAGDAMIAAQAELLEPVANSDAYRDYLAGDACRLLTSLDRDGVESVLGEAGKSAPELAVISARQMAAMARAEVDAIARSARFRSRRDLALFSAHYYCFAAAVPHALLSPARQGSVTLDRFGATSSCKEAARQK